jgi:hypothetical protein
VLPLHYRAPLRGKPSTIVILRRDVVKEAGPIYLTLAANWNYNLALECHAKTNLSTQSQAKEEEPRLLRAHANARRPERSEAS